MLPSSSICSPPMVIPVILKDPVPSDLHSVKPQLINHLHLILADVIEPQPPVFFSLENKN